MKRKRTLADLVPPGAKFKRDLGLLALGLALFVLLGSFLIFVIRYENARSRLYEDVLDRRLLRSGADRPACGDPERDVLPRGVRHPAVQEYRANYGRPSAANQNPSISCAASPTGGSCRAAVRLFR